MAFCGAFPLHLGLGTLIGDEFMLFGVRARGFGGQAG